MAGMSRSGAVSEIGTMDDRVMVGSQHSGSAREHRHISHVSRVTPFPSAVTPFPPALEGPLMKSRVAEKKHTSWSAPRIALWSLLAAIVFELMTLVARFGLGLQSTRDTQFLAAWTLGFRIHHGYIGVLGPTERAKQLLSEIQDEGADITEKQLERVFSPVGLDIGADNADEIALAIIAEILAVIAGRNGGFLRERKSAIHNRRPLESSGVVDV